jgi:flagellar basal body-associated protein FliL
METNSPKKNENPPNKVDTIIRICIVVAAVLLIATVIAIAVLSKRINSFPQR